MINLAPTRRDLEEALKTYEQGGEPCQNYINIGELAVQRYLAGILSERKRAEVLLDEVGTAIILAGNSHEQLVFMLNDAINKYYQAIGKE